MLGTVLYAATAVLAIDVGWEPHPEGNLQYVIQIEPELFDTMSQGRAIGYDVRPEHRDVRHFRVQVGTGTLPRIDNPVTARGDETIVKQPLSSGASDPATGPQPPGEQSPEDKNAPKPTIDTMPDKPSELVFPAFPNHQALGSPPSSTDAHPKPLPADPASRPINGRKAGYDQPIASPKTAAPGNAESLADTTMTVPLMITSSTSAGLLAALMYLCWIHLGTRRRYHALLADYYAAVGSLPGSGLSLTTDPAMRG